MHVAMVCSGIMLLAALLFVTPWTSRPLKDKGELLETLGPYRFEKLMQFVDETAREAGPEFWLLSGGLRGILVRLGTLRLLVREVQVRSRLGRIDARDVAPFYWLALAQCFCSAVGVLEAILIRLFPSIPHLASLAALQYNWNLTLRAVQLCLTADEGFC